MEVAMNALKQRLARLRGFNAAVRQGDPKIAEESADLNGLETLEVERPPEVLEQDIGLESIIMRRQRPVLAIRNNEAQLVFEDPGDSEIWTARLNQAKSILESAIRAVGRVELKGSQLEWVGTGWLVADTIMVTNRHVANAFAMRKGAGFTFQIGSNGLIRASVDFLQEINNPEMLAFELVRPLYIEDEPGPDIAFFEVAVVGGNPKLATPIELASKIVITENVATIGYPAYDSRIPEPDLMEKIYGKIYNKKRLAPGGVTRVEQTRLLHNCTTLGGNSGSAVVDLDSGKALGLHFSGSFLATNYAVRADVVKKVLDDVRSGRVRPEAPVRLKSPTPSPPSQPPAGGTVSTTLRGHGRSATVTIPLTVTVSIGDPGEPPVPWRGYSVSTAPVADDTAVAETEAVAADYRDRGGYQADFLGKKFKVDLPSVDRDAGDVLDFKMDGNPDTELRYEHYSVLMSRSRRMCFFSACNIDGNLSKKSKRVGWKWDPRIPKELQIMQECYGSPPKFSRGHMTRREDPGWGNAATAKRGNQDSMHVTNATPQMQAFNAPIWLALEDYALGHAKEDEMKISVFTGPYFHAKDPEMYGVLIPRAFWKIIAFIHDDTGKLCATGYEMNQEQSLQPEEEFVFGAFTSPQLRVATQVPIRSIETRSGISFGKLASVDPLAGSDEGFGDGSGMPLGALEQIRFIR
jgi:endonuclease G